MSTRVGVRCVLSALSEESSLAANRRAPEDAHEPLAGRSAPA